VSVRKKKAAGKAKKPLPAHIAPKSPDDITKDVESFVTRQLEKLHALSIQWPPMRVGNDGFGKAIVERAMLAVAKNGVKTEADALSLLMGGVGRAVIREGIEEWADERKHIPKCGPNPESGTMQYLGVHSGELPGNLGQLRVMTDALIAAAERQIKAVPDNQRYLDELQLWWLTQRRASVVRDLERAEKIRGHPEFLPVVTAIIRLTVAYTRYITSMEVAPELSRLAIQQAALRHKSKAVPFGERLKIVRLNSELTKSLPKTAVRYRAVVQPIKLWPR